MLITILTIIRLRYRDGQSGPGTGNKIFSDRDREQKFFDRDRDEIFFDRDREQNFFDRD
jgi:hypothetical protein